MKAENGKWKIGKKFVIILFAMFLGLPGFSKDVGIGAALGLRTYLNDGTFFTSSLLEGNVFIDGENFGLKLFADFSFYTGEGSNLSNNVVTYNTESASTKEGFGLAPYYFFKNDGKLKIYAGPLISFNFLQTETLYTYVSTSTKDVKIEYNYLLVDLGLFIGTKVAATEKVDVFFEFPVATQLAKRTFSYKINGTDLNNYKSSGFGTGGGTSFRTYFMPKLGIVYKL